MAKRFFSNEYAKNSAKKIAKFTGREFVEGEMRFKDLVFDIYTGQTATSVLSKVPFSESFIEDETERIFHIAKEIFPYKIYKGTEKEKPNDAYIVFFNLNCPGSSRIFIKVRELYENGLEWFKDNVLSKLGIANACMSFCTFYKKSTREAHIFSINSLVVDIDCDKAGYSGETGHYIVEQQLFDEHFDRDMPAPTYIEEGNNLRLVYVLEEPLYVAGYSKSKNFAKLVMKKIADKVNYLGADYQNINSYVRLVGSANTKGWKWNPCAEVSWRQIGRKLDFDYIVFEFLPERDSINTPKKTKNKYKAFSAEEHNSNILSFLEKVQKFYNKAEDTGHREMLCFLYRNYSYLLTGDSEKALKMMLEFNEKFNIPLIEKQIISSTNNVNYKRYKYRHTTLLNCLGIKGKEISSALSYIRDRRKYQHEYYESHKQVNKELQKRRQTIKSIIIKMKKKARKNIEIVAVLFKKGIKLSLKTVEWYITKFRKSGELAPT